MGCPGRPLLSSAPRPPFLFLSVTWEKSPGSLARSLPARLVTHRGEALGCASPLPRLHSFFLPIWEAAFEPPSPPEDTMKPLLLPLRLALLASLALQLVKSDEKISETPTPLHSNSSITGPSNSTSIATSKPTPPAANATAAPSVISNSTAKPTTVAKTTATSKPTSPPKEVSTEAVKPTPAKPNVTVVTTPKPVLPSVTVTVTPKAAAAQASPSGFSAASFIGGILLTLGLLAIGYVGCKTYHAKRGVQYRTIDEHDAII
uniref:Porimin n=1 Tax=Anolis carolinensis TaxID=28377 RepID=G1KMK5_ANOCA|nr:PREDICTED: porimin [Anolis carolinensis]|eukprot:XP_008106261.2 PREDICTED: porimin [Anolis carolinensis]